MSPISGLNRVLLLTLLAGVVFVVLAATIPTPMLIVGLNGVFLGTATAVVIAYGPLLWNAILGVSEYDRVRQMTIGFALCWIAYGVTVAASIYIRSAGGSSSSLLIVAAGRFIAIIAAAMQVTAPDFGLGLFYGRDRKVLFLGSGAGLVVAVIAIYAQVAEALSF